jgi:hypothetical protein
LQWETSSGKTSCPLCREGFNDFENTKEATAYKTTAIKPSSAALTSPIASLPTPEVVSQSTGLHALALAANSQAHSVEPRRKRMVAEAAGRTRQSKSRRKMLEAFCRACTVYIGALVSIRVDKQDRSQANPRGLIGIVFHVNTNTHSVKVAAEHGILSSKGKVTLISSDDYEVHDSSTPMSECLEKIQVSVLQDSFHPESHPFISVKKAHDKEDIGAKVYGSSKCKCRKQPYCSNNCACRKANKPCTSACGCNGNCVSTHRIYESRRIEEMASEDEIEDDC